MIGIFFGVVLLVSVVAYIIRENREFRYAEWQVACDMELEFRNDMELFNNGYIRQVFNSDKFYKKKLTVRKNSCYNNA